MIAPKLPPDEPRRLESLQSLHVLDTPAEERFDRITRLARRLFDVPIAMVSLVDASRQWFKSCVGLEVTETSREVSFCGHAILGPEALVVPDAREDRRFADNPLVTGPPFIRFYAGQPLRSADGRTVGAFCIVDRRPRTLGDEDLRTLRDLAFLAEAELNVLRLSQGQIDLISQLKETRRKALTDSLTRLWNRAGILEVFRRELDHAARLKAPLGVLMADLDRFKRINDTHGHPAGDAVLRECAHRLRMAVRPQDAVGRYGGEEFLILLPGCGLQQTLEAAERVCASVREARIPFEGRDLPCTVSCGAAVSSGALLDLERLLRAADAALYRAKEGGRDCVCADDPGASPLVRTGLGS